MQRREFVVYVVGRGVIIATGGAACSAAGCGTFIHPERCGQPHSNQIDWKIAALDGLGLLLFFVPGVVAFIVDFCTGAIYLPIAEAYPCYGAYRPLPPGAVPPGGVVLPPEYPATSGPPAVVPPPPSSAGQPTGADVSFKRVALPRQQLHAEPIEQVVSQHVGRPVSLAQSDARVSALARIDQFDEQADRHRSDTEFGESVRSFFNRLVGV
jgi:hypothetical protein